jgi:TonB family protein
MRFTLALLSIVVPPALAAAQEPQPVETETFVPIVPIVRINPDYPTRASQYGKEGWVIVSFVVSETGEVEEPMIEDSSGEAFEQVALDAIKKWRYTPATVNGNPVAQSMMKTRLTFQLEGPATGVTRGFQSAYRAIKTRLDAGDYAAAEPLLAEMELGGRHNLYEDALFWPLKYGYLEGIQSTDTEEKLRALQLALGHQADEYLPPDMFVAVSQRLYVLQVQAVDFSAAQDTFERLRDSAQAKKSSQYASVVAELTPTYEQIEQVIAGPQVLTIKAEIGEHDYWVHNLMRRSFSMANVNGRVDAVDVRCDRGTRRYATYPQNAIWQVSESWGECGVYIQGEPGATFTFAEHPAGTPATPLARE